MKARIYREMSADEKVSKLDELKKQLFDVRSQAVTETLENTKSIRNIRRDIARLKTVISQESSK